MALPKITKLSWIYDLHRLAQSSADLECTENIYHQILVHIVDGFEASSGCFAQFQDDQKSLQIVAGIDIPPSVIRKTVEMGEGVLGWVAQESVPLLLNGNITNDVRFRNKTVRMQTPSSSICWPLKLEDRLIGVISVNRRGTQPVFEESDLEQGTLILNLVGLVLSNLELQLSQRKKIGELKDTNRRLKEAQIQLVQADKLASIGQLAAGVAHEINNPIGFISSNFGVLEKYLAGLFTLLELYERGENALFASEPLLQELNAIKKRIDLPFLKEDIPSLMKESRDGIVRVRNIIQNLKDFSRVDSSNEWQLANLHQCIESTISIAWNQLKYKVDIRKEFGDIPEIECLPLQLNQVFLNMLVNAGQAITERGVITIRTSQDDAYVNVAVSDTGGGIPPENLKRIFDPFFTTKKIGEGTGLGLSVSYGIVQKHHGKIDVQSEVGKGTTFTIRLPLSRVPSRSASVQTIQ